MYLQAKVARTYWSHNGFRIYEIPFPVGEKAAYFVVIGGSRHYFRSLHAVKSYLDSLQAPQP